MTDWQQVEALATAATAGVTLVAVTVAGVSIYFLWRSTDAAKKAAEAAAESARAARVQTAPWLSVSGFYRPDNGSGRMLLFLDIENVGLGPARDVRVTVTHPKFQVGADEIHALGPKRSRQIVWGTTFVSGHALDYSDLWESFNVDVEYTDVLDSQKYFTDYVVEAPADFDEHPRSEVIPPLEFILHHAE